MTELNGTAIENVADLAQAAMTDIVTIDRPDGYPGLPENIPALLNRNNGQVQSVYELFTPWRNRPERVVGTAKIETLDSFIELVERHKTAASAIFAMTDWRKPSLTAIIDYHDDEPANCKHRIHYAFPLSEDWQAWLAINGKPLNQTEFAEFIEDHIEDLASPDDAEKNSFNINFRTRVAEPSDLITLSRGLQINAEMRVRTAVKTQSGESQIVFEEEHKDASGAPIDVPGIFILCVAPFFDGERCRIPVRLRYRVKEGKINWSIQLFRPDVHVTKQVRADLIRAALATELPRFEGAPEA